MKVTEVTLSILRTELDEGVIPTRGAVDKLPQLVLVSASTAEGIDGPFRFIDADGIEMRHQEQRARWIGNGARGKARDEKSAAGIDHYSTKALSRVWKAVRFSWWMTSILHKFPDTEGIGARIQLAELDYVVNSKAAMTSLSENYVGLPF